MQKGKSESDNGEREDEVQRTRGKRMENATTRGEEKWRKGASKRRWCEERLEKEG